MNVKKQQIIPPSLPKRRRVSRASIRDQRSGESSQNSAPGSWFDSIQALKERNFQTTREAIDAIIEEAARRQGGVIEADQRDTIALLFETDPLLSAAIDRILVKEDRR